LVDFDDVIEDDNDVARTVVELFSDEMSSEAKNSAEFSHSGSCPD
jgi:hypothetical protein